MTEKKSVFKTNIIYGLIFLVPLAVIILAMAKIVEFLRGIAEPLGYQGIFIGAIVAAVTLAFFLGFCFVVGAFVRTRIGAWSFDKLESMILQQIPGYEIVGNVLKGFTKNQEAYSAVTVQLHGPGTAVFGFVMEKHENGRLTVFLPSSPALTVGSIIVVESSLVTFLEAGAKDLANCISQWGIGSSKVLKGDPQST
ncbi:MAG: DUF502 domain-containing protein [Gammaproteobacteria bacterium]|nr:DUF502 domain-containing protein [Gammaproteobacteria bacterium]